MNEKQKTAFKLSVIILIVSVIVSLGGLLGHIYNDNQLIKTALIGNDLATLFIAVPLMLYSMRLVLKKSTKGHLIWMGTIGYMVYNYLFYLYGTVFNKFFLLYVVLLVASIYALIFALLGTDVNSIAEKFGNKVKRRLVGGYMVFFGTLLGGIWIAFSLNYVVSGKLPQSLIDQGTNTNVVFATDLSVLIPAILISAIYLFKNKAIGYILSTVVLVKASTYGIALIIMSLYTYFEIGKMDSLIGLWIFLSAGCTMSLIELLRNIREDQLKMDVVHHNP